MSEPLVRPAVLDDAEAIAIVHHTSWVQTYSDLLPAEHWETDTVEHRVRRWHEWLSGDGAEYPTVAVVDEQVVGFGKAGATRAKEDIPPVRSDELWSLYVLGGYHGTGIGGLLLDTVLPPSRSAELWVADANPRARRFYEKQGFISDGTQFMDDDLNFVLIRMVR